MVAPGIMSSVCPCKDCPNKGCGVYHSKCEKYLKFLSENEKRKKALMFENQLYSITFQHCTRRWKK